MGNPHEKTLLLSENLEQTNNHVVFRQRLMLIVQAYKT